MVYLGVDDENALLKWKARMEMRDKPHVEFREPDIGNQMTAIACVDDGKVFSRLKLL